MVFIFEIVFFAIQLKKTLKFVKTLQPYCVGLVV